MLSTLTAERGVEGVSSSSFSCCCGSRFSTSRNAVVPLFTGTVASAVVSGVGSPAHAFGRRLCLVSRVLELGSQGDVM